MAATIEDLAAQMVELVKKQQQQQPAAEPALAQQRAAVRQAASAAALQAVRNEVAPASKGLSTPTIVCIAFIVLVVIVVGVGIACFSCSSGESSWSDGIARYLGGGAQGKPVTKPATKPATKLAIKPAIKPGAKPANKSAVKPASRPTATALAGVPAKAGAKAATPKAGAKAGAGGRKFLATLPAAPAGSKLLSQRVGGGSETRSVRSQRLATAIEEAKRPKKKALVSSAVRAAAVVTGTAAGSAAGTGFKGVQSGGVQLSSIGASGAGRLARTETQESRETIMKQGRGSRLTREQIKEGILQAHKRGRDPSRAVRLVTTRVTAVDQEAWRPRANPKTKRTDSIPCGAHPTLAFYDDMKARQLAAAAAAR
jgi:hypothetical protein